MESETNLTGCSGHVRSRTPCGGGRWWGRRLRRRKSWHVAIGAGSGLGRGKAWTTAGHPAARWRDHWLRHRRSCRCHLLLEPSATPDIAFPRSCPQFTSSPLVSAGGEFLTNGNTGRGRDLRESMASQPTEWYPLIPNRFQQRPETWQRPTQGQRPRTSQVKARAELGALSLAAGRPVRNTD